MKIISLTASNVKRLRAVEITPDGTMQIVTGRNAQGKTSVLDAIWLALGGGAASKETPRPVRDGETIAHVTLDLGDLIVTRTWDLEKAGKSSLTVTAPDGAKYGTPQTLLDQMVGKLSFDPLAFTRLSAKEQRQALLDLLGLDFSAEDRTRAKLFDERTDVGRRAHAFGDLPKLEKDAPLTEVSSAQMLDRIRRAEEIVWEIKQTNEIIARGLHDVDEIEKAIATLKQNLGDARKRIATGVARLETIGAPEDLDALRAELLGVEERNKVSRDNQRIAAGRAEQKALEETYYGLGQQIASIDRLKAQALADAAMPVEGLGFSDEGVTFRGIPFQQASSAEQIRVSLAMAMALNPTLRVIRILDGSLLDADSMAEIAAMAKGADYQVWVERVSDETPGAVVIEDGSVTK